MNDIFTAFSVQIKFFFRKKIRIFLFKVKFITLHNFNPKILFFSKIVNFKILICSSSLSEIHTRGKNSNY